MKLTRILTLPPAEPLDQKIIAEAADCLRRGMLVIIPTDTVYGIAADFHDPEAAEKLRRVKDRPAARPIPVLASDRKRIETTKAHFGAAARKLAKRYWPGPLTLVLPVEDGWEGFRVPDHPVALAIIKAAGGLLRVTSANMSGQAPALTAEDAGRELRDQAALAVDSGRSPGGAPSTVVKIVDKQAVILREGAIAGKEIFAVLNESVAKVGPEPTLASGHPSAGGELKKLKDKNL